MFDHHLFIIITLKLGGFNYIISEFKRNSLANIFNIRLSVKTQLNFEKKKNKQNSHLIKVYIFRNGMKRFHSTFQEMWFMCIKIRWAPNALPVSQP